MSSEQKDVEMILGLASVSQDGDGRLCFNVPELPLMEQLKRLYRRGPQRPHWETAALEAASRGDRAAVVDVRSTEKKDFARWIAEVGLAYIGRVPGRVSVYGWV